MVVVFSFFDQETESSILEAEPLVGKGVGAALFLASKKGSVLRKQVMVAVAVLIWARFANPYTSLGKLTLFRGSAGTRCNQGHRFLLLKTVIF